VKDIYSDHLIIYINEDNEKGDVNVAEADFSKHWESMTLTHEN
jgi:hypothetical protein